MYTNSPWVYLIKVCSNGGATYISHKIMAQKPYFHIFYLFSETTAGGASYYA